MPTRKTIRQMLEDVEAVTRGRFYPDPNPIASPVEMFLIRDGRPGGETFDQLSGKEKWQVLGDYTRWHDHEENGISFQQMDQIFSNVIESKPRAQWLDGTGLPDPTRKRSLADLKHGNQKPRGKENDRGLER